MIGLDGIAARSTFRHETALGMVSVLASLAAANGCLAVTLALSSKQLQIHADVEAVGDRDIVVSRVEIELALRRALSRGDIGLTKGREDFAAIRVRVERVGFGLARCEVGPMWFAW